MNLREFKRELCSLVPPSPHAYLIDSLNRALEGAGVDPWAMCCLDEIAVPSILSAVQFAHRDGAIGFATYRRILGCLARYTDDPSVMVACRPTDKPANQGSVNQPKQCSSRDLQAVIDRGLAIHQAMEESLAEIPSGAPEPDEVRGVTISLPPGEHLLSARERWNPAKARWEWLPPGETQWVACPPHPRTDRVGDLPLATPVPVPLIALTSHAPGSGKSTVASRLATKGFSIVPFARPIKEMAELFLRYLGTLSAEDVRRVVYRDRNEIIPGINITGRHLLQTLGTEWGRQQVCPDVWLQCWANTARALLRKGIPVVVDDLRFPNEADLVTSLGGRIWLVKRPGAEQAAQDSLGHVSEGGLKDYQGFSAVVHNDRGLDELAETVDALLAAEAVR